MTIHSHSKSIKKGTVKRPLSPPKRPTQPPSSLPKTTILPYFKIPEHFKEANAEVLQLQKLTRAYKFHYAAVGILLTWLFQKFPSPPPPL